MRDQGTQHGECEDRTLAAEEDLGLRLGAPAGSQMRRLGRYLVLRALGEGSMGMVVHAYDPKLEREVALKWLRRRLDDSSHARLIEEARAMARLSHPNVVEVYDVEDVVVQSESVAAGPHRRLVIAMEYVHGGTLREWLDERPRSWWQIVAAFVDAGRGLSAAHEAGLLHRDFKPSNVLIAETGAVKVTDFGLATSTEAPTHDPSLEGNEEVTTRARAIGTPRYMAPEQHAGLAVTEASDQYALCVALWEALHGKPPFTGLRMDADKSKGPPPWSDARTPPAIARAIERGLRPDPAERWPSLRPLLAALGHDRSRRRRRFAMMGVWGALPAVGVGVWVASQDKPCAGASEHLVGVWDDARRGQVEAAFEQTGLVYQADTFERARTNLDGYANEWVAMHVDACEATSVRGEQSAADLDLRMSCLHRARTELDATVTLLADADAEVVQRAATLVRAVPAVSSCADLEALRRDEVPVAANEAAAVERGRVLLAEIKATHVAGRYGQAEGKLTELRALAAGIRHPPLQAQLALAESYLFDALARHAPAAEAARRALRIGLELRRTTLVARAAQRLLFTVGFRQNQFDAAKSYLALARGAAAGDPLRWSYVLTAQAAVLDGRGRYDEAQAHYLEALAIQTEILEPGDGEILNTRNDYATSLLFSGRVEEAERQFRASRPLLERVYGPTHPKMGMQLGNLAACLLAQGRYEDADPVMREALALMLKNFGPNHSNVASVEVNLATALDLQGKSEEAAAHYLAALPVVEAELGLDHPTVAKIRLNLGSTLARQRQFVEAEGYFRQALELFERTLDPDHPDLASARQHLAELWVDNGRELEAVGLAEAAYRSTRRSDIAPSSRAMPAFTLAKALWATAQDEDQRRRAVELADEAVADLVEAGPVRAPDRERIERWGASRRG